MSPEEIVIFQNAVKKVRKQGFSPYHIVMDYTKLYVLWEDVDQSVIIEER